MKRLVFSIAFSIAGSLLSLPLIADDPVILDGNAAGSTGDAVDVTHSTFLIGNSLTWDTVPSRLDGDVRWHVDCGKPLPYIYANPQEPCVKTSTLWPTALVEKQYDLLCIQPHYGSTLSEDVEAIAAWIRLQPKAVIVVHTGWARSADRVAEAVQTESRGKMVHSRAYFLALLARLRQAFPDREFRTTGAMLLLEIVAADIAAGKAPFRDVSELYRDKIHMNVLTGRYLMHNAMRQTLGQSRVAEWNAQLDPELQIYLDSVLERHAEATAALLAESPEVSN